MPAVTSTLSLSNGSTRTGRGTNTSGSLWLNTTVCPFGACARAERGSTMPVTRSPVDAITVTGAPALRATCVSTIWNCRIEYCCCRARLRPMNLSLIVASVPTLAVASSHGVGIDLVEDQRLDQQARRIDDLEQLVARRHHLAGDDARRRDHAVDRRAQVLGRAPWPPAARGGASPAPRAGCGCPPPSPWPRRWWRAAAPAARACGG